MIRSRKVLIFWEKNFWKNQPEININKKNSKFISNQKVFRKKKSLRILKIFLSERLPKLGEKEIRKQYFLKKNFLNRVIGAKIIKFQLYLSYFKDRKNTKILLWVLNGKNFKKNKKITIKKQNKYNEQRQTKTIKNKQKQTKSTHQKINSLSLPPPQTLTHIQKHVIIVVKELIHWVQMILAKNAQKTHTVLVEVPFYQRRITGAQWPPITLTQTSLNAERTVSSVVTLFWILLEILLSVNVDLAMRASNAKPVSCMKGTSKLGFFNAKSARISRQALFWPSSPLSDSLLENCTASPASTEQTKVCAPFLQSQTLAKKRISNPHTTCACFFSTRRFSPWSTCSTTRFERPLDRTHSSAIPQSLSLSNSSVPWCSLASLRATTSMPLSSICSFLHSFNALWSL